MKTVQDWGFLSKEQGLVKPKLQENKIFHALTAAYENNHQQEIYGATENIVRREKELCELALGDLKRLGEGKGDTDATLKMIMDHYQGRLLVAKEKEEKINLLSEDSRKMTEEYKKKTQELAEVKRNLMESQAKLRDLAKSTEKLLKKEEELRFIEGNLRTELDKNKKNIINGLYEIVADLSDIPATPSPIAPAPVVETIQAPMQRTQDSQPYMQESILTQRQFQPGIFPPVESNPVPRIGEGTGSQTNGAEAVWTRDSHPPQPSTPTMAISPASAAAFGSPKTGDIMEKAQRLKMFEPGKSLCSKSMVKTPEGEVISEYFYSPLHAKESRHYLFNALFAVGSLLALKAKDEGEFQERLETVFTDLLSRLEHSRNIHLEGFLADELNRDTIAKLLSLPRPARADLFEAMAKRILGLIEHVGPSRPALIERQFRDLPKADFTIGGIRA